MKPDQVGVQARSTSVEATAWRGYDAWQVTDGTLEVVIVPRLGGKIAQLTDLRTGREWLHGASTSPPEPEYGGSFVDHGPSGWDEMIPTIDPCRYPVGGRWATRWLPDHGEAWMLPWQVISQGPGSSALTLRVEGRVLPYQLTRTTELVGPGKLLLRYRLVNLADEPFACLWAAHPLFRVDEGCRVELPAHVRRVINVRGDPEWGPPDEPIGFPVGVAADGRRVDLGSVAPAPTGRCRKHYLPPDVVAPWSRLRHVDGASLTMHVDPAAVPYLGVWVDEGVRGDRPMIALEPATGYYDALDRAHRLGRFTWLEPRAPRTWWLDVEIEPPSPLR